MEIVRVWRVRNRLFPFSSCRLVAAGRKKVKQKVWILLCSKTLRSTCKATTWPHRLVILLDTKAIKCIKIYPDGIKSATSLFEEKGEIADSSFWKMRISRRWTMVNKKDCWILVRQQTIWALARTPSIGWNGMDSCFLTAHPEVTDGITSICLKRTWSEVDIEHLRNRMDQRWWGYR